MLSRIGYYYSQVDRRLRYLLRLRIASRRTWLRSGLWDIRCGGRLGLRRTISTEKHNADKRGPAQELASPIEDSRDACFPLHRTAPSVALQTVFSTIQTKL